MSLLMDALKRAEQEKKDAARRLAAEDELSATRKEAISEMAAPNADINVETGLPAVEFTQESPADRTFHTSAMDLALEPLEITADNPLIRRRQPVIMQASEMELDFDPDATLNVYAEKLNSKPAFDTPPTPEVEDGDLTQEVRMPPAELKSYHDPDQTFSGVKLEPQVTSAGLYDDTVQGEAFKPADLNNSYDETLPGVPAAQLARDIGTKDQPTPVAAQTLFTATNTIAKPSSGFRWLLISLCVLAIGSAIVFYYYTVTPVSRNIPSPMVARGVETILPSQNIAPPPGISQVAPVVTPAPAVVESPVETVTVIPGPLVDSPTPDPAMATNTDAVMTETPINASAPTAGLTDAPAQPTSTAPRTDTISTGTPSLPEVITPPASVLRISRNPPSAVEGRLLGDAFTAYQQGNYELARQLYQQAGEKLPDNRDVLLGLAAVATKTGDIIGALQLYMRLVQLNPLDNLARAALISLQPGDNPSGSISAVKSMLADSPEQPSLYFTLGKLYAAQANWSAAQQAFFDAYRLDSANPDYAFNLAVSLDRLDQSQSALDYYSVALGLAESNAAGFNRAAVADRVLTLEAGN